MSEALAPDCGPQPIALGHPPAIAVVYAENQMIGTVSIHSILVAALTLCLTDPEAPTAQRGEFRGATAGVFKATVTPHWFDDGSRFWYRNDLRYDAREYILVDAIQGVRELAFDHDRLAAALRVAGVADANARSLSLDRIEFNTAASTVDFQTSGGDWRLNRKTHQLTRIEKRSAQSADAAAASTNLDGPRASTRNGPESELTFVNRTGGEIELFWLDSTGQRRSYGRLAPGAEQIQHTFAGHVWEAVDATGRSVAIFQADEQPARAEITPQQGTRPRATNPLHRRPPGDISPDGNWRLIVRDHNLFLRATGSDEEFPLAQDGTTEQSYGMPQWSPDSRIVVAFKNQPGAEQSTHLIESSPRGGGRAKLHTRTYPLPGDRFASYRLQLFDVATRKPIDVAVDPIDFGRPKLRWRSDGRRFTYEKVDRGHQRFRVIEVDAQTGQARALIDEKSETFIWTAHTESLSVPAVTWLEKSDEILYISERDGWRHIYLIDTAAGQMKQQITKGEYVVRGVDRIDEDARQIWFRASGRNAGQDPYLVHYYRVNFDGSGLVALTDGDGNHSIQYSPSRAFLIDRYSRVDLPPRHELRRVADGKLICKLEEADISQLTESGWQPPEVFVTKGRDGKTDIWGIICRPANLDPAKKYPILEDIYAGPQDSFVPKTFSSAPRYSALTNLGIVVVKIDGMGTANRSKAFHDVCWKNLKDAGFADRIPWIKAAASKYAYLDASRVGIFGTSAGGQNAAAAVLFHPEFYQVAFAACGCHDNRMDKASWNEQWMGYPVGPQYAECSNIDNAHRLQGRLMLLVGEMDTNVPPESTMRFADALVRAGKDFDLVVLPGADHTGGGAYGQRRMQDFFVRHLLGTSPPDRNAVVASRANGAESTSPPNSAPRPYAIDLSAVKPNATRIASIGNQYHADRGNLARAYPIRESATHQNRIRGFDESWLESLVQLDASKLTPTERNEWDDLKKAIERDLMDVERVARTQARVAPYVPFGSEIIALAEARHRIDKMDGSKAAATVSSIAEQIRRAHQSLREQLAAPATDSAAAATDAANAAAREANSTAAKPPNSATLRDTARTVARLRLVLKEWFDFYNGYDPGFSWWMREPYARTERALDEYLAFLNAQGATKDSPPSAAAATPTLTDVPDLNAALESREARMPALLEKYQADRRVQAVDRRGRATAPAAPPGAADRRDSAEQFNAAWNTALDQLDFDGLSRDDRIDYLLLRNQLKYETSRGQAPQPPRSTDPSALVGRPVGRAALLRELEHEMIAYTPDELVEIAESEYRWCAAELKKAAREMGLGDDWRAAVDRVKAMHAEPGKQPELIRELAWEAIQYLERHDLVTVPPIARETWRMQMMSPQRQLVNPFFTGGEVISVSYPTDTMSHEEKLQSMRGNNIPFARATVHHELIPGHHLQGYMSARHRPYRNPFATPFWGEGWALYWEMVLYDRGFPATPEDRIGFLVWRSHRCARIVFSLGFHLGTLTPEQCVDLLVDRVGFERNNAAAEVRRSIGGAYSPLYQAAYMLGGLQIRSLRRELVDTGKMNERAFHDAVLKQNSIPIELLRAALTYQPLTRDFKPSWKFYIPDTK